MGEEEMFMKKLFVLLLAFLFLTFIGNSALASDELDRTTSSQYRGYISSIRPGIDFNVFEYTSSVSGYNVFGGRLFSLYDTIQWSINRHNNSLRTFNYFEGSLQLTTPWWSSWREVGNKHVSVWDRTNRQMEANAAVGLGFGIGLSGSASASKSSVGAKGSLSVTIGQVVAYWSATSVQTTDNPNQSYLYRLSLIRR